VPPEAQAALDDIDDWAKRKNEARDTPATAPERPTPKVRKRMVIQAVYLAENGEEISKLYQLIKGLCVECKAQVAEINTVPF
jgi:hypothetical protein